VDPVSSRPACQIRNHPGSRTCCTTLARSARIASRPVASFTVPASRPVITVHTWIRQALTRKKPHLWNIGPVITGPMFHRAGWCASRWPHGPRRPLQALSFAAGGCREPAGKTGLGHLEPGHIFTGPGGGSGPSPRAPDLPPGPDTPPKSADECGKPDRGGCAAAGIGRWRTRLLDRCPRPVRRETSTTKVTGGPHPGS